MTDAANRSPGGEKLAEALHQAEAGVVLATFNVARPQWFALAEEQKVTVRTRAAQLMERYGAPLKDATSAERGGPVTESPERSP